MKLLINGYTIGEHMELKVKSCKMEDIFTLDKAIGHLKRNKTKYTFVVMALVVLADMSGISLREIVVASETLAGLQTNLENHFKTVIRMLQILVKFACLGSGFKEFASTILNGGNMKEAFTSSMLYWLGYLFMEFYPSLYDIEF